MNQPTAVNPEQPAPQTDWSNIHRLRAYPLPPFARLCADEGHIHGFVQFDGVLMTVRLPTGPVPFYHTEFVGGRLPE